ncbi:flagellar hook assembly protein FlgD [Candidatus Lariskella endosymbiont of Hedychridium roseum]|uniref:flagellar hook assembly protein FlgD n=1 Tax=Candidatus Lariskella endosymbiont of Hedychridium roseum TaxID=3077949 RepID=UPI0030CFC49B
MYGVSGIQDVANVHNSKEDSGKKNEAIRKKNSDDFANLLKLQIKALTPNPMEKQDPQAIAQIATSFANTMGMQTLVEELQSMKSDLGVVKNAVLIGKPVKYEGDGTFTMTGSSTSCNYFINSEHGIETAKITIKDMSGTPVYEENIKQPAQGEGIFTWNGRNNFDGEKLPDGKYIFDITAIDKTGKDVRVTKYNSGQIELVVAAAGNDAQFYIIDGKKISKDQTIGI